MRALSITSTVVMFFRGTRLTATARATTIAAGQKNFPRLLLGRPVLASAAIATSAITTGTAVVALCDGTSDKSVKVLTAELTKAIDTDGDGKVTHEELTRMFKKLDANKDGQITLAEWEAYLKSSELSKAKSDALRKLFKDLDKDNSGTISQDEFENHFHYDYAARYARSALRTFISKGRFLAYTSDIGEAARPTMPLWFVNGAYALTFVYVFAAIGHHTHEAYSDGASRNMIARAFCHSASFELIASVAMPSLIIHQAVHFAQHQAHRLPPGLIARWIPTLVGLGCIPFLPYVDHPTEQGIDMAFEYAWPVEGSSATEKKHH